MSTDTNNVGQVVDYNSDDDNVVVRYNTKHKGEEVFSEYVIDSPSRSNKRVKRAAISQLTNNWIMYHSICVLKLWNVMLNKSVWREMECK